MASGFQTSLKVGQESSYGVPALNMVQMPVVRPGIKASQNLLQSKALLNDVNPRFPVSGNRAVMGTVECELSPITSAYWSKWLCGGVTTTAAGSGTGYLINFGAGYAVGAATLAVDTGTGTIPAGSFVSIGGILYRVNSSTGGGTVTSISIDGGLVAAVADNAAVTVSTLIGHKMNLTTAAMQSLFLEVGYADISRYHQFVGCYVNKADYRITAEGLMTGSFDIEGKDFDTFATSQNPGTTSNPSHQAFSYFGARIYRGDSSLLAYCKELSVSVSRALDGNQYVIDGTGTRYEIPAGIAVVEGSLKALFPSDTLTDLANDGTETSIRAIMRSSTTGYFGMYFPEVRFKLDTPEVVSEAVVEQTLPFIAFYDDNADATAAQFTHGNSQASYSVIP